MRLVKARKDYKDSCREFIMDQLSEMRKGKFFWNNGIGISLTFSEWRLIAESIRDGWRIPKGTIHEHSVLKMDDIYQWRSKPGLTKICQKYDLFPEC